MLNLITFVLSFAAMLLTLAGTAIAWVFVAAFSVATLPIRLIMRGGK